MKLKIYPQKLKGAITPPPSKSQAHRLLIAAALAQGESRIDNLALSKDISATIGCMRALGAVISADGRIVCGTGGTGKHRPSLQKLDCCESGSTLRFLIPVALVLTGGGIFTGQGRLMERPQGPYERLFAEKGIAFLRENDSLRVEGRLLPGIYALPGDVSSQFITGLMYALPLLDGDSKIMLTTPLESSGYVDMTIDVLGMFGIRVETIDGGWHVPGGQHYVNQQCQVESDYSQAGFYYAAKALGNEIDICGLLENSAQGDRVIVNHYNELMLPGEVPIDVRECPDLVPPLALMAALRAGETTKILGAARLRGKESDRLDTVTRQLNALGADVTQTPDSLIIRGVESLHGGSVSGCNDHRIAMMLAIAATASGQPVILDGAECVSKSYPDFWEDYVTLGGCVERMD